MSYDSAATRERILAAATREFAARGVAGARIDKIATAASANKRAIYDYFRDKDGLFAAVLERQMSDCAESVPIDGNDLSSYAQALMEYHAAHPEVLRLLLWEALELGEATVPAEQVRTEKYRRRVEAVTGSGVDLQDAQMLIFFTLGLVNWISAVPQLRRMILGDDYDPARLTHAVSVAVRALAEMTRYPPDASLGSSASMPAGRLA